MILNLYGEPATWEYRDNFHDEWLKLGCGPGDIGDYLVPDRILGLSVVEACRIHDWYYRFWEGTTEVHRAIADRVFKNNMLRIIHDNSRYATVRQARAWIADHVYYESVHRRGAPAFFSERNANENMRLITVG